MIRRWEYEKRERRRRFFDGALALEAVGTIGTEQYAHLNLKPVE